MGSSSTSSNTHEIVRGDDVFPRTFGKYVLLRPLAKGGMGQLYLAASGETGGFEKLCVVKKVLPGLEDPAIRRRFLDEAKVVVRLNQANLVQVFDAGVAEDEHYLAMELVEGRDLRGVWNRCAKLQRRIPVDVAVFVIRELCRGLSYVHDAMELDLVHRDVSPPNILVGYRGMVKLTDFGLAKHAIKRELTNPGVVYGRFSYLSPEQALGMPVDRRSDVFAAGIILWELLTGRQLYPSGAQKGRVGGKSLTKLHARPVKSPSSVVPGIPRGLDEVVLRALERDTDRRYQTAEELRTALSGVLSTFAPSCDVDRIASFMSDIFAKEIDVESRDYGTYVQEDFSEVRSTGTHRAVASEDESSSARSSSSGGWSGGELARRGFDLEAYRAMAQSREGLVAGDKYKLKSLVGIGAMGAVYEAEHLTLGRIFALKVLHPEHGLRPELVDRMWREAQAATRTGHPNIVNVIDTGMLSDDEPYLVMELVHGDDLGKLLEDVERLEVGRAVDIATQLCRALSAAHGVGIIHRDIKPENIMVSPSAEGQPRVKLFDFGLCGDAEEISASLTTPGMVLGSPDYMAPEQAAGAAATPAFDMYSLGSVLFKMLSGRVPFQGRNAIDVLMKKGAMAAPSVRSFVPGVPAAVDAIIAECLDRDPSVRPKSAADLERRLESCLRGEHAPAGTPLGLTGVPTPSESFDAGAGASLVTVHQQAAAAHSVAGAARLADRTRARRMFATAFGIMVVVGGVWTVAHDAGPDAQPGAQALPQAASVGAVEVTPQRGGDGAPEEGSAGSEGPARSPAEAEAEAENAASPGFAALAAGCERALAAERWSTPPGDNVREYVDRMQALDPENPDLRRLREQSIKTLARGGAEAIKNERWGEAAALYRPLFAMTPGHKEAKTGLVKALARGGWIARRRGDHLEALAAADEILTVQPENFSASRLRASSLLSLERYEEAVAAFRAAMRLRPKHTETRRGYWRARRLLHKNP